MQVGSETDYTGYDVTKKCDNSKNGFKHDSKDVKSRGEVFTPTVLVNEMLDKLPPEVFVDKSKTFIDNSCGNGQFLYYVMLRKMENIIKSEKGITLYKAHRLALTTIYGCELDANNAEECRKRLLNGSTSQELRDIVDRNIITADALDPKHEGWSKVGFYWSGESFEVDKAKAIAPSIKIEDSTMIKSPIVITPKIADTTPTIELIPVKTISSKEFYSDMRKQVETSDVW